MVYTLVIIEAITHHIILYHITTGIDVFVYVCMWLLCGVVLWCVFVIASMMTRVNIIFSYTNTNTINEEKIK